MKQLLICVISMGCLNFGNAFAAEPTLSNSFQQALREAPSAELPAKALDIVNSAEPSDRISTTTDVIKGAIAINPAAAPNIVGTIARALPDLAAVAAGAAAAEKPKQATAIAKAAVAAAPSQAGKIVAAICRAVPKEYRSIAITAAQIVPDSANDILKAVASSIPELKPGLEDALAAYSGRLISVVTILDQVSVTRVDSDSQGEAFTRGPTIAPPFIPISRTVRTISPDGSGEVPTGGRDYGTP